MKKSPSPLLQIVGRAVQRKRKAAGLTQEQLAAESSVHVNTVLNLENGKLATVQFHTLEMIAAVLGISVSDLFLPAARQSLPNHDVAEKETVSAAPPQYKHK